MKEYVLITEIGDVFEEVIKAEAKDEAIRIADVKWDKLSELDKARYNACYLAYAEMEDGFTNWDTMEVIKEYK